jgi:hypothetical protein
MAAPLVIVVRVANWLTLTVNDCSEVFAEAVAVATAVLVEEAERVCVAVESISVDDAVRRVLSLDAISVRPALRFSSFVCESCNLVSGRCSSCMSLETIDAVSMPEARPETWNIDESDDPDEEELTVPTMACP